MKETRTFKQEIRAEAGEVTGVASSVNSRYDLGWFEEEIARGAFDEVLSDDVAVLFNHDANMVLGRTSSGTAKLFLTKEGHLAYSYKTPDRQLARDVEDMIRTGDVFQSSFAFTIEEETWRWAENEGEKDLRTITKVKRLYDVSPVTYPANPNTSVQVNSEVEKQAKEIWERAKRSRVPVVENSDNTATEEQLRNQDNDESQEDASGNLEFYKYKLKVK